MASCSCKSRIPSANSWTILYVAFACALLKLDSVASLGVRLSRQSSISYRPSKISRNVEVLTNQKMRRNQLITTSRPGGQTTACNMLESIHETSDILSALYSFLSESLILRNIDIGDIAASALTVGESAAHNGFVPIPTESIESIGSLGSLGSLGVGIGGIGIGEIGGGEGSMTSIATAAAASIDFNAIFSKAATTGKAGEKLNQNS